MTKLKKLHKMHVTHSSIKSVDGCKGRFTIGCWSVDSWPQVSLNLMKLTGKHGVNNGNSLKGRIRC